MGLVTKAFGTITGFTVFVHNDLEADISGTVGGQPFSQRVPLAGRLPAMLFWDPTGKTIQVINNWIGDADPNWTLIRFVTGATPDGP